MSALADDLARVVRKRDPARVRALLQGADETARRACLPEVKALAKAHRDGDLSWEAGRALAVARVGTAPGAAAVVTVLRTRVWECVQAQEHVVGVLLEREVRWLPDVVQRLALVPAPDRWTTPWPVLEALRQATAQPRPLTDPYLLGLARSLGEDLDLPAVLAADPSLGDVLLPLLAVPDIGLTLAERGRVHDLDGRDRRALPEQAWRPVLLGLVAAGRLDRSVLLDTVLDVLLRGGKAPHLSFFTALLEDLAPTGDEVHARLSTWGRLLSDGTGRAAAGAQRQLRALDEDGRLDVETVLELSRAGLARPEKATTLAQLAWLERLAARYPDRREDVVVSAADGLLHERRDVQERTLQVLGRLAPLPPAVRDALGDALDGLAPTLRPEAVALLGDAAAPPEPAAPPAVVVGAPVPADPPVRDLDALADAVGLALRRAGGPLVVERVLDGVAALAARDLGALGTALEPFRPLLTDPVERYPWDKELALGLEPVAGLLHTLLRAPAPRRGLLGRRLFGRRPWRDPAGAAGTVSARAREVATAVLDGQARRLLAFPATRLGATDAEQVVAGLERDAREGLPTWPLDLEQALLRLPREPLDPALRGRLERCGSPAAARALALLDARPEPLLEVVPVPWGGAAWPGATAPPGVGLPIVDVTPPPGTEHPLLTQALSLGAPLSQHAAPFAWEWHGAGDPLQVLLTLPQDREVVAAHLLVDLFDTRRGAAAAVGKVLALLPEAGGPTGTATALAVAYAAAGGDLGTRTAAVDALHGFAARGGLPPALLGETLALLLRHEDVKPARVAATLAEAARGPQEVRALVAATLLAALPEVVAQRRRGAHDLLAVATETVTATGTRAQVPGLDALADERGSTRWHVEARRLAAALRG